MHLQSLKIFNLVSVVLIINRHITKSSWEMWDSHCKCVTLNSCLRETAFQKVHISAAICVTSLNDKNEDKWQVVLRCENYCAFKAAWETKPQNDFLCSDVTTKLKSCMHHDPRWHISSKTHLSQETQTHSTHAYGQVLAMSIHLDTTAWACLSH